MQRPTYNTNVLDSTLLLSSPIIRIKAFRSYVVCTFKFFPMRMETLKEATTTDIIRKRWWWGWRRKQHPLESSSSRQWNGDMIGCCWGVSSGVLCLSSSCKCDQNSGVIKVASELNLDWMVQVRVVTFVTVFHFIISVFSLVFRSLLCDPYNLAVSLLAVYFCDE